MVRSHIVQAVSQSYYPNVAYFNREISRFGSNLHYDGPKFCPDFDPLNYFIRPSWSATLDKELFLVREHEALLDEYSLVKPGKKDNIKHVLDGCIGVYKNTMEAGFRFPFHPFAIEVLNSYNIEV